MHFSKRTLILGFVCLLCASLVLGGCASSEAEDKAAEALVAAEAAQKTAIAASEASIAVVPSIVTTETTSVVVYGSGFLPGKDVSLLLAGKWTYKGGEFEDPGIDGTITNNYGAFSLTIKISGGLVSNYGLGTGIYTIRAVQGEKRAASACLIVEEP